MTNTRHDAPGTHRSHAAARDAWPLTLALPDGRRADLVPGSRPARYAIDDQPCDIDVTIPEDLAAVWFWHGSWLCDGAIRIYTGTFGVAGALEQARIHMRLRAEYEPQPVQMELFAA